jgi:hypothetical protein
MNVKLEQEMPKSRTRQHMITYQGAANTCIQEVFIPPSVSSPVLPDKYPRFLSSFIVKMKGPSVKTVARAPPPVLYVRGATKGPLLLAPTRRFFDDGAIPAVTFPLPLHQDNPG